MSIKFQLFEILNLNYCPPNNLLTTYDIQYIYTSNVTLNTNTKTCMHTTLEAVTQILKHVAHIVQYTTTQTHTHFETRLTF